MKKKNINNPISILVALIVAATSTGLVIFNSQSYILFAQSLYTGFGSTTIQFLIYGLSGFISIIVLTIIITYIVSYIRGLF